MDPIISHLLVLLAGIAAGAGIAITWKVSHERRRADVLEQEAVEEFQQVESQMPELAAEMRADLSAPETRLFREFLVIPEGAEPEPNDPTLAYSAAKHADLDHKLAVLKKHGFLVDISTESGPRFRMTEEFVRLLLKKKVPLRYRP